MKKLLLYLSIIVISLLNFGCPVGLDYALGNPGKEKIDTKLIGIWSNSEEDPEVVRATISKIDNYSYKIVVNERGSMYSLETDELTAWVTKVDGKLFLYMKPDNEDKYYHYLIVDLTKDTMITSDVSLLDGGVDAVTSTATLKNQVKKSMKMEGWATETITWTKE